MKLISLMMVSALALVGVVNAEENVNKFTEEELGLQSMMGYRLGKNDTYLFGARPDFEVLAPGLNMDFSASCSGWDVGATVSGLSQDLDSQLNKVQRNLVNAFQGFVTQLPMLLLQRYDPGTYEILQNMIDTGDSIFEASVQDCQDMTSAFRKDGFASMQDKAFFLDVAEKKSTSDGNITGAMHEGEEESANKGLKTNDPQMVDGTCGDSNDELCRTVEYAAELGHKNQSKGVQPLSPSDEVEADDPWIWRVWRTPDEAADWVTKVVGNIEYGTCESCEKIKTTPPMGAYDDIADESKSLREKFSVLVDGGVSPSLSDLKDLSTTELLIDETVITALREENAYRGLFISRVSDDIALMRVVEKLIASRRILLAGSADSLFASNELNVKIIKDKIALISDEISMIKQELELKRAARGDTIITLLGRFEARNRKVNVDAVNIEERNAIQRVTGQ